MIATPEMCTERKLQQRDDRKGNDAHSFKYKRQRFCSELNLVFFRLLCDKSHDYKG